MSYTLQSTTEATQRIGTRATRTPTVIDRVVAAARSPASGQRLYSMASRLAQLCGVRLDAVFVEDANLLNFAALPFARVINVASAKIEPLDFATLARQLRSEADQLRALFLQAVANQPWSGDFSVLQGNVCQQVVSQMRPGDLLVCANNDFQFQSLSHMGQTLYGLLSAAPCSIWIERGVPRCGRSVVSVVDRLPIPWHAIRQALFWSQLRDQRFICLVTPDCPDPQGVVRAIADFLAAAQAHGAEVFYGRSAIEVMGLLHDYAADVLVLDAYPFRDAPEQLRRWLSSATPNVLLATDR